MTDVTNITTLPQANIRYPKEIEEQRSLLIEGYKKEKENPSLRTKLMLVAQTLIMLRKQIVFENINKVKAMAVYEKDRLKRLGVGNDGTVDRI